MNIKDIDKLVEKYDEQNEDNDIKSQYVDEISSYMKNNNFSDELVSVIIKGVKLDGGVNFLDYIDTVTEKELSEIWKKLSSSRAIKNDKSRNSLIILMQLLYCVVIDAKRYEKYIGKTLELIIRKISDKKNGYAESICSIVFIEYFVNQIVRYEQLPDWCTLSVDADLVYTATNTFLSFLHVSTNDTQMCIVYNWLKKGNEYALERIRVHEIEKKIPTSKIAELEKIINHYEEVETQVRKQAYDIDSLNRRIEELNDSIRMANKNMSILKKEKAILEINLKNEKEENAKNKAEIERLRVLSVAQINDKADSIQSLLNEIGRSLKAEYEDYYLTKNKEMNEMLGEIYRGKLDNIAKILKRKGIKVQ